MNFGYQIIGSAGIFKDDASDRNKHALFSFFHFVNKSSYTYLRFPNEKTFILTHNLLKRHRNLCLGAKTRAQYNRTYPRQLTIIFSIYSSLQLMQSRKKKKLFWWGLLPMFWLALTQIIIALPSSQTVMTLQSHIWLFANKYNISSFFTDITFLLLIILKRVQLFQSQKIPRLKKKGLKVVFFTGLRETSHFSRQRILDQI